jgi:NTP pyrophosphatase (non-canonical NTP hydrolase)
MSSGRTIREWQKEVYGIAREHGFHENETPETVPIAEKLCLIHSEVSEALEEARQPDFKEPNSRPVLKLVYVKNGKPEGIGIELADAFIRILDLAESLGIDMEDMVVMKSRYNENRPHKHGKVF